MSKLSDTARNFVQQYSALTEFATALVAEGYDEEKNINLKAENEKLDASINQKKYQLDRAEMATGEKRAELNELQRKLDKQTIDAEKNAAQIVEDADKEALKRVAQAKQRIAEIKMQAATEQDEASKRIAEINDELSRLTTERDAVKAEIAALKQKFM